MASKRGARPASLDPELQMTARRRRAPCQLEPAVERRLGKSLSPRTAVAQRLGGRRARFPRRPARRRSRSRRDRPARSQRAHLVRRTRARNGRDRALERQSRRHRVATESRERSGWRVAMASNTSRMCTPGTERAEPRSVPVVRVARTRSPAAHTILDAARHETDDALVPARIVQAHAARGCGRSAGSRRPRTAASACSCISRFDRAPLPGSAGRAARRAPGLVPASASRQRMPMHMSSSRPAAFRRGADGEAEIRGREVAHGCAPPTSSSARMPGTQRPARMRRRPCATRMRLFASSGTRSATVPSATRSSSAAGDGAGRCTRRASAAALESRAAPPSRRTRRRRRRARATAEARPAGSGLTITSASGSSGPAGDDR